MPDGADAAGVPIIEPTVRLWPGRGAQLATAGAVVLVALLPLVATDYQLTVLAYAGVAAIGGLGLNLLTGYTGQVSLGYAFSLAVGAYSTAWLGARHGLPIVVWLPASALIGAVIGTVVGPVALRLRGHYLAMVTIGLVFVGQYVFEHFDAVTGGSEGASVIGAIPAFDAPTFAFAGATYTREQGLFWLIWAAVGVSVLLCANLVRSRSGRAMQAVRDHDLAAEVLGVSLARTKLGAFAVSSAFAAVAGALYAVLQVRVQPADFSLMLSVQYIAIIVIGGIGTIHGPVLGALLVGTLPRVIERLTLTHDLPFVAGDRGGPGGFIEVASLNTVIYGVLIVLVLVIEPRGLAAVGGRARSGLARVLHAKEAVPPRG